MSDLIDRQQTIDAVAEAMRGLPIVCKDIAEKVIKQLPSVEPHWIPVTERLPEVGENVLLSYFDEITIGWLNSDGLWSIYDGWKCVNADEISAWMPLPEPYKER